MKLFLLLVLALFPHVYSAARAVTHEDIKEAMINLLHLLRDSTEKLERHEGRERQLAEHLRKALSGLDSRGRAQDNILKAISKTLSTLEQRVVDMEERSRQDEASKGTYDVDGLPIQTWTTQVQTLINEQDSSRSKMEALETSFNSKLDYLGSVMEKMQAEMSVMTAHFAAQSQQRSHHQQPQDSQMSLYRDWHKTVTTALDNQSSMLYEILKKPENARSNATLDEVISFRNEVMARLDEGDQKSEAKLDEIVRVVNNTERIIVNTVKDAAADTYQMVSDIQSKVVEIEENTDTVQNVEKILIQTSDNVMDTKRRIEYGVHQILQEVKEFLESQGGDLNQTVSQNFQGIKDTIESFQTGTVGNLSIQVGKELSQVWRQIGVMHQQITTSAAVLDKLQNETDTFITDNEKKMDEVTSKLDTIGSNINQIQDNHNFLMGRLSLFTHEFNETRVALSKVSQYMRDSYDGKKSEHQGPGPIFLDPTTEYKNVDENRV